MDLKSLGIYIYKPLNSGQDGLGLEIMIDENLIKFFRSSTTGIAEKYNYCGGVSHLIKEA